MLHYTCTLLQLQVYIENYCAPYKTTVYMAPYNGNTLMKTLLMCMRIKTMFIFEDYSKVVVGV